MDAPGSPAALEDHGSPALRRLLEELPGAVDSTHANLGDATAVVDRVRILDVLKLLRDDPELEFEMLLDVTAVDYLPRTPRFEVVYHLYSVSKNHRVRIKAGVPEGAPQVASAVSLYESANWMEGAVWYM